jgi:GTP cyclohydrolase I
MKLYDLINRLDSIVPENMQENWDNSGVQINCGNREIRRALVALEITFEVIEEAVREKADMIITHHPLIFTGVKSIDADEVKGRYIIDLINNGISVYSMHTNFDKAQGGNNDYIAQLLDLDETAPLLIDGCDDEITRTGYCQPMSLAGLAHMLADGLGIDTKLITITGEPDTPVSKVGICSGAGSEYIEPAMQNGCDVFITGDVRYHEAVNAREMGMCVIDAGHFGTERIFPEAFTELLYSNEFTEVDFIISSVDINPFEKI